MRPQFSGHETFALRAAWPKKAYDAAREDAHIFSSDAALARLGVGKNMVRAMRHWSLALGILDDVGRGSVGPTVFGRFLLDDAGGADPFLEDAGTPWLLHWRLCRHPAPATLWHFVFGCWSGTRLDKDVLARALEPWLARRDAALPAATTLGRDLQCLQNCYLPPRALRGDLEDRLASPLADLGLVGTDAGGEAVLRRGVAHALPLWVFAHAVLDFWQHTAPDRETLAFADVLYADGSPGRVFGLGEEAAFGLVERLERAREHPFSYRDSAGIRQLYRVRPGFSPLEALRVHYASASVAI